MSQQQGQGQSSSIADSNALLAVFMIGLLCFFFWLIWTNTPAMGENALNFAYYLQYPFYWLSLKIGFGYHFFEENARIIYELKKQTEAPTIGQVFKLGNRVGLLYVPIVVPILLYFAYKVSQYPIDNLKRKHTAKSLLYELNKIFPYTAPVLNKDFLGKDAKDPAWQPSTPPHVFALGYNNLKYKLLSPTNERGKFFFHEDLCRAVYENELGDFFDVDTLKPYEMALMGIFLARVAKNKDYSKLLMDGLAKSCAKTKDGLPDFDLEIPYYKKNKKGKMELVDTLTVKSVFEKFKDLHIPFKAVHKYTRTALMSMLLTAKLQGKLSSSYFLWIKPLDRDLWYALNRVGAPTPFTQSAGLFCHWMAEQIAWTGKRLIDWTSFVGMLSDPSFEGFVLDGFEPEQVEKYRKGDKPFYELKHPYVERAIDGLFEDLVVSDLIYQIPPESLYFKTQDASGVVEMKKVDLHVLRQKNFTNLKTYQEQLKRESVKENNTVSSKELKELEKEIQNHYDFEETNPANTKD